MSERIRAAGSRRVFGAARARHQPKSPANNKASRQVPRTPLLIPSALMREASVVGFMASNSADVSPSPCSPPRFLRGLSDNHRRQIN